MYLERIGQAGQASPATLRQRKSLLNSAMLTPDTYGGMTLKAPTAIFITIRDARAATPAEAENMMKAARSMYNWTCDSGYTEMNPLGGIKKIHRSKGGATPWTPDDLRKFKHRHPLGTMAHLALTLHMFTAARSNSVV